MNTWTLTLLVMHMLATYACAVLFTATPDRMQRLVMFAFMVTQYVMVIAYSLMIKGVPAAEIEAYRWFAQEIEHNAVLLYLFRLYYIEAICKNCSPPPPLSPR